MTVAGLDFPEELELMMQTPVGCFPDILSRKQTEVPLALQHFNFGYALTVHKMQGSQWQDVLIYDEQVRQRAFPLALHRTDKGPGASDAGLLGSLQAPPLPHTL